MFKVKNENTKTSDQAEMYYLLIHWMEKGEM